MEQPSGSDLREWVDYFYFCRERRIQSDGVDIVEDKGTMFTWFCNLYMMGYDKAKLEQMYKDAGVESIEEYMDKLMEQK